MSNSESQLPFSRVIYDTKRVKRVEDYGEAVYRSRFHRQTIPDVPNNNFTGLKSLQDYIADRFYDIKKDTEFRQFFPHAKFDAIITPEIVLQLVKRLKCYRESTRSHQEIAQDIYYGKLDADGARRSYRKLLAAMILADDDLAMIETYIKEGMSDDCLPVFLDRGSDTLRCRNNGHRHQAINRDRRRRGFFLDSFIKQSQQVMIPLIEWREGTLHHHYVMKTGGVLPAVFQSVGNMKGGFGEVTKVKIDDSDGWFGRFRRPEGFFALKRLVKTGSVDESTRETEFDLEVRSLIFAESRADRVPGPYDNETKNHLIQLLVTFEVYEEDCTHPTYYLLFPWADGNLDQFWRQFVPKHSARRLQDLGWMVEQFMRLGKALQCIHNDRQHILSGRTDSNRFGRHGDIKPANFLYFRSGSGPSGASPTLVLADFGLGRLHSKETRSKDSPSEHLATVTYQAPEYEIQGGKLSPRSDIFSLGCVLLEYITWLLRDADAIDKFSDLRVEPNIHGFDADIFYTIVDSGRSAILKESVKKWISSLQDHPHCVEVVGEMLELIHHKMLDPDPATRITSAQLVNKLVSISNRWKRADSDYGTRHWKQSDLDADPSTIIHLHLSQLTTSPELVSQTFGALTVVTSDSVHSASGDSEPPDTGCLSASMIGLGLPQLFQMPSPSSEVHALPRYEESEDPDPPSEEDLAEPLTTDLAVVHVNIHLHQQADDDPSGEGRSERQLEQQRRSTSWRRLLSFLRVLGHFLNRACRGTLVHCNRLRVWRKDAEGRQYQSL